LIARRRSFGGRLLPVFAVAAPLIATSCAARAVFIPPAGPGRPAEDPATAWDAASGVCRSTSSYRADFGLTGQVGDRRIRGLASARLSTAITAQGAIGLEAAVSGQLLFRLAGNAESAVLLLRDPDRVVSARPEEILEALIGVGLGPERLLPIFSGCVAIDRTILRAVDHGRYLEVATADTRVFLESLAQGWQTRAGYFDDLAVEYHAYRDRLPRELTVHSTRSGGPVIRLDLAVRDVVTNGDIAEAAFRVALPPGAAAISLDELREAGPLVDRAPAR
jgi:hypothetical protein